MVFKKHTLQRDPRTGLYFARVQHGKTRKRFVFDRSRKSSAAQLRQLTHDLAAGRVQILPPAASFATAPLQPLPPLQELRVSLLIMRHLDWVQNNRSPGTFSVRKHFLHYFQKFVGDILVAEINRLMLENFYTWARKQRGAGPNAGNAHLRHVKTMFLWAEEMGLCDCPVKKFPATTETLPTTRRFTDEELAKLFAYAGDGFRDFRDMLYFGLLTGLRPQELREFQKDQVMRDGRGDFFIFIEKHKTARMTKKAVSRSVPLNGEALEIVKRRLAVNSPLPFLFLNGHGQPWKKNVFRQRLIRWCIKAGIPPRPPYALRHTFGSMEAEANINQTSLSQIMGHTTIRTTSRYISNNYDHHRNAVGAIMGRVASLAQPPELVLLEKQA